METLTAIAREAGDAIAPLNTLSPEPFEIIDPPLFVSLRPSDGEYIAALYEAGVSTTAETRQEAIAHLSMMIVDVYRGLAENEHRLTDESLRRLGVLRSLIRPRSEGAQVG